jgi:hypothetical protein
MISVKYVYMVLSLKVTDISATEHKCLYRLLLYLEQETAVLFVKKLTTAK